jgi:hypothetical protein
MARPPPEQTVSRRQALAAGAAAAAGLLSGCAGPAGLSVETLVGLEGLLSNLHERVEGIDADTETTLRALARDYREDPAVVEMSEHILAVGRIGCASEDGGET